MCQSFRLIQIAAVVMIAVSLSLAVGACTTSERSESTTTTRDGAPSSGSARDRQSDVLAGDDTDRAAAELDAQKREREAGGQRPAATDSRGGTRAVDQPRVGGRP